MSKEIESIDSPIDINKITGSDKFVKINKIIKYNNKDNIISKRYEVEGVFFKTSSLDREKLSDREKLDALKRMQTILIKLIKHEVKEKLIDIQISLTEELEKKYNLASYIQACMKLETKLNSSEQFLSSSESEELSP
jgi:hypothetical protein